MQTCSQVLSQFVLDLKYGDLPSAVGMQAKKIIFDGLGLILSGYNTEHGNIIHNFVASMHYKPEATIIGYGTKTDCMNAAFANGVLAYTHDYSDTVLECVVHCEPVIIPTILALGENRRIDGKSLITAAVAGYEIMTRVAMAANSGVNRMAQQEMGFHPTGVCGVFGSAAAAGKILANSVDQLLNSFGIAGSFASGILEALTSTPITMARRLSGGKSAFSGILSALLARNGFTGPKTVFEGKNGFLTAFTNGRFEDSYLQSISSDKFFIMDAAIKYRNCIHAAASPIDVLLEIMSEYKIRPESIKKIEAGLPKRHYQIFTTKKDMYHPITYGDAQTSLPYCLAVACLDGEVSVDQFSEERMRNKNVLNLAEKIFLIPDEAMDAAFSEGKWPARIEVTTNDGKVYSHTIEYPKGSPQNPLSFEELKVKFESLSHNALNSEKQNRVFALIANLEKLKDVSELISFMVH